MIDLRSDTVTRPSEGMRRAMYEAEVGDDVFGEDPTVIQLQEHVANLLGKEAALFVSSGVMGNQLALKVHTQPADEVIVEANCHIFNYESGGAGLLSGVQLRTIEGVNGILNASQVQAALRAKAYWEPRSRLVCLENTHNKAGGTIYPLENIQEIGSIAKENQLAFHLDGARIWNASAASGISEATYAAAFDTLSVCLSKGLGAPVGSILAGSKALIQEAHRYRKMWGGGMRQIGSLAAAGLYALQHHRSELYLDHLKARKLAEGLSQIKAFSVDLSSVQTNIVMFDTLTISVPEVLAQLKEAGIAMVAFGPKTIRATTHRDVSEADIDAALLKMSKLFG
jgi:threonine aldolase